MPAKPKCNPAAPWQNRHDPSIAYQKADSEGSHVQAIISGRLK
jgi:hypothetical protein